jgi:phage tail sheath protein FI
MATTYLSPGVYIEEVDKGTKPIQGVPTAVTAFVGFTERAEAPNDDGFTTRSILSEAKLITNWGQYQAHFGGLVEDAYLPYAVRGFFDNGGAICHVISVRTLGGAQPAQGLLYTENRRQPKLAGEACLIIHARKGGPAGNALTVKIEEMAKAPQLSSKGGARPQANAGKRTAAGEETPTAGESAAAGEGAAPEAANAPAATAVSGDFVLVIEENDKEVERHVVKAAELPFWGARAREDEQTHKLSERVKLWALSKTGKLEERLPKIGSKCKLSGGSAVLDLEFIEKDDHTQLASAAQNSAEENAVFSRNSTRLFEGNTTKRKGIGALEAVDNVNLLCAPDVMLAHERGWIGNEQLRGIQQAMLDHCARTHYRFAVLDAPANKKTAEEILDWRVNQAGYDSMHGALYYPWLKISDPVTGRSRLIPPSGHIAGVYARSDDQRGVHKAPANEVVAGVIDVATNVTKGEQDLLNPAGINCIRKFPGRGVRVWGARTLTSDPSWRYVNVRRLFNYVEESVERSTQWIVFEPNDQILWAKVRRDITAFLRTVWLSGALFGATPEQSFYVKCDESTNLPELRDLGQMVCEIGMAPVKPAEFVIFRFSQWADQTAEA